MQLTCNIDITILSVRPSVCLTCSGIVLKRLDILSAEGNPVTKHLCEILMDLLYGGIEYDGIYKFRDFLL